jgi:hypothetical protein
MIGITIPIVLLDNHGPTTDKIAGRPCIELGFTTEPLPPGDEHLVRRTYGMIDTGADHVAVDASFAGALKIDPQRVYLLSGSTGSTISGIHRATLVFFGPAITLRQETDFVVSPQGNSQYKVLLGRSFLRNTRFRFEGPNGIDKLEIYPAGGI